MTCPFIFEAEIARRAHRLEKEEKRLTKENLVLPLLVRAEVRARISLSQGIWRDMALNG